MLLFIQSYHSKIIQQSRKDEIKKKMLGKNKNKAK
jgi:hypothetical protein